MKSYLDIVRQVLEDGEHKQPVRDGVPVENDTIGVFGAVFRHDMAEGFPLLTTKKMPFKIIATELEGFIKGVTSKKWFQNRDCHIWDEWANPRGVDQEISRFNHRCDMISEGALGCGEQPQIPEEPTKKEVALATDDLGPIYGYQWRKFGQVYDADDCSPLDGYDQLKDICDKLKSNPYDRRMVCSAWNPLQLSRMALPPCHLLWNVVVYGDKLNLVWHQRSCDLMLGVPFNIASYGLLLELLAKHAGLKPGILQGTLADCHIYTNQLEAAREQLKREPRELPKIHIFSHYENSNLFYIDKFTPSDISLRNYDPHPKLKFNLTV